MRNVIYLVILKPTSHRTVEESLGVEYLASVLMQEGYHVKIRDAWLNTDFGKEDILEEIIQEKENVLFVGTSSYMLSNDSTCDFIGKLRKEGIGAVAGGYGPTFEAQKFLKSGAKLVMIGEGERSIVQVAKSFLENNHDYSGIKGIAYLDEKQQVIYTTKQEAIFDLDTLPYPQRPYIDLVTKRHSTVNVLTSRGCMGACTFCSISAFLGKQNSPRWRCRSIDNIIGELKVLQQKGIKTIKFIDDSFIENERDDEWCKNFYEKLQENGIRMNFRASIRADKVTEANMKYLHDAGFFSFSCGIENGSTVALKRMAKRASVEDNKRALDIFQKNHIYVQGGFILFDDNTTMEELEENYAFLKEYIWLVTKGIFSEMYAAVGTQFTKNAKLESDHKFASNNIYVVKDEGARKVYDALKKWQLHHSKIYDMVIDPISAPKAIPVEEMKKYYELMIQMKNVDILYMRKILDAVENTLDTESVYHEFCLAYNDLFQDIYDKVTAYYENDGLDYDAQINGFLTINN
ncbi:MAG: B12-binding domain-containing radical SAM protein [Clostridia bacterium]|nr:B12-binding domain-containing radical SAM protein [Clostridia bacterium]